MTLEDRLVKLEISQAVVHARLKYQDKLLWGLYGVLGGFITYMVIR
jgi:hypothetical protein